MAAEDRAKLKELLLPAATAVLAPRPFDLVLDESGITLDLAGTRAPIATAAEIADGTFKTNFTRRLADAAGIEDPVPPSPPQPAHQEIPIPWIQSSVDDKKRESKHPRGDKHDRRRPPRVDHIPSIRYASRMPSPKWVTEAAEMTGTVDAHSPEPHPVCGPPRLTRRAQQILDEIRERHRE